MHMLKYCKDSQSRIIYVYYFMFQGSESSSRDISPNINLTQRKNHQKNVNRNKNSKKNNYNQTNLVKRKKSTTKQQYLFQIFFNVYIVNIRIQSEYASDVAFIGDLYSINNSNQNFCKLYLLDSFMTQDKKHYNIFLNIHLFWRKVFKIYTSNQSSSQYT